MSQDIPNTLKRTLRYGMVGGGPDAFIGEVHRKAIALDRSAELVAGCFSRDPAKSLTQGRELGFVDDGADAGIAGVRFVDRCVASSRAGGEWTHF